MKSKRVSAIDAFFVAYQESSGVLMQLGVEVELQGESIATMLKKCYRISCGAGRRWANDLGNDCWDWRGKARRACARCFALVRDEKSYPRGETSR